MNIHDVIGTWKSVDPTLKMMQAADQWCLYDEEPFYILTNVASICSFDTFMEFWRDVLCVNITPNFICYIWDMCDKKPDEFLAWVSDLYDNYAIIEPFGGV